MFLKEFKDLRRKRDKLRGLPDQLNYAIPIDDYTIALKDGAFLSAFECSGLDLNSASVEELDAHRAQGNRALARLDDGFQYNIDLFRYPSVEYSSRTFPDPVSAALDREREIQYSAEGQHFETRCVLTITYRPPADAQTRIAGVFLSGAPKHTHWRRQLNWFKQKLREFEDAISPVWKLTALRYACPAFPSGELHQRAHVRDRRAGNAYLPGCDSRQSGPDRRIQAARRRKTRPRRRSGRVSALLICGDGRVPERTAHLLSLLDPWNSGRTENGDQPADRLPAQLVPEATRAARHHQRALRFRRRRSLSKPACTQNGG